MDDLAPSGSACVSQRVVTRARLALRAAAFVMCAVSAVGGGCDTIAQDFRDFGKNILPKSPSEAGRLMIDPNDPDARREGTTLIAQSPFGGADPYLRAYRDYAEHERDPIVRATAIRALGRHGTPEDAKIIIPGLTHQNRQVRWEVAKALQRLHAPESVPELLKVLRNDEEDVDVRVAAATALGQYKQDRVFQGLVAALNARELAINNAAERSLVTLTGQDHGHDIPAWLHWYNQVRADGGDAFANASDFTYPTYSREETFLEKLAFWSKPTFEQPGTPVGLRPSEARSTYGEGQDANEGGNGQAP